MKPSKCCAGGLFHGFKRDKPKSLEFAALDVIKRRKPVNFFKVGKLWLFKYFFEDKETFKALAEFYNKDQYRFEFKPLESGTIL
jgi:hypothetical protein